MKHLQSLIALSLWFSAPIFANDIDEEWDELEEIAEENENYVNESLAQQDNDLPSFISNNEVPEHTSVEKPFHRKFLVYGDMLYWKASDSATNWALKIDTTDSVNVTEKKYGFDFDWDFGFRIGMKYNIPWNDLLVDLNWTRFHTSASNVHQDQSLLESVSGIQNFGLRYLLNLMSTTVNVAGNPYKVTAHYKAEWDQIDLSVGKKLNLMEHFFLVPYAGVRFLINDYSLNMARYTDYYGATEVTVPPVNSSTMHLTNSFTAIGLMGAILGHLELGKGFGTFFSAGGFIGSANCTSKNTQEGFSGSSDPSSSRIIKKPRHIALKSMIDIATGVDWTKSFMKERLALNLTAAYEFHVLFDSPTFIYDVNTSAQTTDPTTNFQLQGLTIRAGLSF